MKYCSFKKRSRILSQVGGVAAIAVFLYHGMAWADIYTYVDARGVVHLTDRPSDPRYQLLMRTQPYQQQQRVERRDRVGIGKNYQYDAGRLGSVFDTTRHSVEPYVGIIREASKRTGVNDALLKAVIRAESAFDPLAVSRKGAVGLMQLMPETAKRYGVKNRLDPDANIHAGARFLRDLLFSFDNDLTLSLAAYNAGEGAVRKYGNVVPPYPETKRYVSKVLHFYNQYRYAM